MIDKRTIILLLFLGIILRLIFANLIPSFTGNDEPAHLKYIQHIKAEKALPNANLYQNENLAGNEYFQPPLYYLLTAIPIWAVSNPDMQLKTLRIFSIFLWTVAFYFTYKILLVLNTPPWLATSTLAFVCLLPTYIVNSSTVTNDALIVPLTFAALYTILSTSKKLTIRNILFWAVLTSLAILTKFTGFILIPAVFLIFLYSKKKWAWRLTLYSSSVFVLTFWWFTYNWITYEDLIGPINASVAGLNQIPFNAYKIFLIIRGTFATFWAAYGPANEIRLPVYIYLLLSVLSTVALIGFLKLIFDHKPPFKIKTFPFLILTVLLLSNIALLFIFNTIQLQPLGRYLFPSLLPIAIIFTVGLGSLASPFRKWLPVLTILILTVLNILGISALESYYP